MSGQDVQSEIARRTRRSLLTGGLAAVAGALVESILSPLFWILALAFFALFFAASRLENKLLRIFLFWIPTLTVSSFSLAIVALITCLIVLAGHP